MAESPLKPEDGREDASNGQVCGIVVTEAMVRAGLDEMNEHQYAEELGYVLECVYRAMAYESDSASSIKDSM